MADLTSFQAVPLSCTIMHFLESPRFNNEYLLQISWPRAWGYGLPHDIKVPVVYVLGNPSLFLTATEVNWRVSRASKFEFGGIVVCIEPSRRPSAQNISGTTTTTTNTTTIRQNSETLSAADNMLSVIENEVREFLRGIFPGLDISREMVFGHGVRGAFAMHALFTRPGEYGLVVASCPLVDTGMRDRLKEEEEKFLQKGVVRSEENMSDAAACEHVESRAKPTLLLYCSDKTEFPARDIHGSQDTSNVQQRQEIGDPQQRDVAQETRDMADRLGESGYLEAVEFGVNSTSDPGSVLIDSMVKFFTEWPCDEGQENIQVERGWLA